MKKISLLQNSLFRERYIRRNKDIDLYTHSMKNPLGGGQYIG